MSYTAMKVKLAIRKGSLWMSLWNICLKLRRLKNAGATWPWNWTLGRVPQRVGKLRRLAATCAAQLVREAKTKKAKNGHWPGNLSWGLNYMGRKLKLDIRKGCRGSVEYCCHMCSVGQRGLQWAAELGRQVSQRRQALCWFKVDFEAQFILKRNQSWMHSRVSWSALLIWASMFLEAQMLIWTCPL